MNGRTSRVTVYVTDERKAELLDRADAADDSVSGIVNDIIDHQLQAEAQENVAAETRAEERIQELVALGVEELTDAAEDIRERQARAGAYAIATFELQKRGVSDPVRREALATGARRIRRDGQKADSGDWALEPVAAEEAVDGDGGDANEGEPDPPDSNPGADGNPDGDRTDDVEGMEEDDRDPDLFDRLRSDRA